MRLPPNRLRKPVVTLLLTAGATAVLGTPVRRWLTSNGRLDVPNHRSSHRTPVPRGGGIAGLLGVTTATTLTKQRLPARSALSIAALSALGWLDDATGHTSAGARFLGQLGAGAFGLSRNLFDAPIAAVTTAGVVNVFNFMDGINGISSLTAAVWGINAMLLEDEGEGHLATLGALAAGIGVGFLPHNVPTARLFLGDVGSYALGTIIATGILSQRGLKGRYRTASPLLLYGVDAAQALVVRARAKENLTEAHRGHVYQVLVDHGYTHTRVALFHALCAALAAVSTRLPVRYTVGVSALSTAVYIGVGYLHTNASAANTGECAASYKVDLHLVEGNESA